MFFKQKYFYLLKQQLKHLVGIFKGGRNRRLSFSARLHTDGRLHILRRGKYSVTEVSLEDVPYFLDSGAHISLHTLGYLNSGYLSFS